MKIGDLGLGRVVSEDTVNCFTKVGTPLYMAPEIIKGEGYNFSCDVWSLGCIVYEMIELNSPFWVQGEKVALTELFDKITTRKLHPFKN